MHHDSVYESIIMANRIGWQASQSERWISQPIGSRKAKSGHPPHFPFHNPPFHFVPFRAPSIPLRSIQGTILPLRSIQGKTLIPLRYIQGTLLPLRSIQGKPLFHFVPFRALRFRCIDESRLDR